MTACERPRARPEVIRRSRVAYMSPAVGAYWLQLCVKAQEAASCIEPLDLPRPRKFKRSKRRASDPATSAAGARIIILSQSSFRNPTHASRARIHLYFVYSLRAGASSAEQQYQLRSVNGSWQKLAPSAVTKPGLRTRGDDLRLGERC